MKKEWKKILGNVQCECGYNNKDYNVKKWGTCTKCGRILDEKAYFKSKMNEKLRLWRDKKK